MSHEQAEALRSHWEEYPCGINLPLGQPGTREFFDNLRHYKYEVDYPEILEFVRFGEWCGRQVLEVGCGLGSDSQTWMEVDARLTTIDFAQRAVQMTHERLAAYGYKVIPEQASALELPFKSEAFDLYYAWGVLMHTGNTAQALEEAFRVLRPGGTIILMLYHKNSLLYRAYVQLLGRAVDDGAPVTEFYLHSEMRRLLNRFSISEMKTYYFLRPNVSRLGRYIPRSLEAWLGQFLGNCTYLRGHKKI